MKKVLISTEAFSITIGSLANVIACSIGDNSTRKFLERLDEINWSSDQVSDGDGYNWYYDQFNKNGLSFNASQLNQVSNTIQGPVDTIFNYDKYSTSYKGANFIKKQATTASPVIKSYRPNGNRWVDFGLESRSRMYSYINDIQNWNDGTDMDLEYNIAKQNLRNRNYVAKSSVDEQQKDTFFNMFHDPSNSSSSINGTKNPFGGNLTNLSYIHSMYTWPAITNKGWLTTSFADYTDYMHKNGVPVLGLWYMSGWEDITRESLRSLLEKDTRGDYKIVDILIEQCLIYNFDGWMINNEANGSQGDGYVIKNSEINEIMREFNKRAEELEPEIGRRLNIVYYTNGATLSYNSITQTPVSKKTIEASIDASEMQLDFTSDNTVENLDYYLNDIWNGDQSQRKKIYSLLNESINIPGVGNYDVRNLINKKEYDGQGNFLKFGDANNSFSIFGSGGANEYAKDFKNWYISNQNKKAEEAEKNGEEFTKTEDYKILLMEEMVSNLYSGYQFFGSNGYLDNNADGYDTLVSQGAQSVTSFYQNDPRMKYSDFSEIEWNTNYPNRFGLGPNGQNFSSYGVGNSFWEKTVMTDSYIHNDYSTLDSKPVKEFSNDPSTLTNFSTGSGINFISRDSSGNIIDKQLAPWTNSRLADVSPTYQWDFWEGEKPTSKANVNNNKTVSVETNDGIKKVSQITSDGQLTGYYDYYNVYKKGNSLAIGMGYDFNKEGEVTPGKWNNSPYYWNLMGTNLQKNNYNVSFYVKTSNNTISDAEKLKAIESIAKNTQIIVTTDQESNLSTPAKPIVLNTVVDNKGTSDGWYKISADLSQLHSINENNRIAKIGLKIQPDVNNLEFLFNVGEMELKINDVPTANLTNDQIDNIENEYTVKRAKQDNNINIRVAWDDKNANQVEYYKIYYSTDQKSWYNVGQTSIQKYYIRELDDLNDKIYIGIQPFYKNNQIGKINYGEINTKYNY